MPWQIAEEAGIDPKAGQPAMIRDANGGVALAFKVTIAKVRVGKFVANNVECVVSQPGQANIPVLLGQSFLNRFNCQIDPTEKVIILSGATASGR